MVFETENHIAQTGLRLAILSKDDLEEFLVFKCWDSSRTSESHTTQELRTSCM